MTSLLPLLLVVSGLPSKLGQQESHSSHHHASHHDSHSHEDRMAKSAANSYLGPAAAASQAVESYLIPLEYDELPEASQAVDTYLIPDELPSAQEEVIVTKALDSYFGPSEDRDAAPSQAEAYYALPLADVLKPQPSIARRVTVKAPTPAPIAIMSYSNTGPLDGNYAYSFETENGISQAVEGRMKMVDETPVYVMSGEYSYPGPEGNMWKVEWYADETGYHPTAPFLPKSVVPNHPEVAAAVAAQLRAAAEQEAAAAEIREVYALPDNSLAGYGEQEAAASQLLDSYSLGQGLDLQGYGRL